MNVRGEAESQQHQEYKAKHSKVVAHDLAIKQAHAERKDVQARIANMNEDNIVEECDELCYVVAGR